MQISVNPSGEIAYRSMLSDPKRFPFTYTYSGRIYRGFDPALLGTPERTSQTKPGKEINTLSFSLPDGLNIFVDTAFYPAFGIYEFTVRFTAGAEETSVLEEMHAELTFAGDRPLLKGIMGDHSNYYQPYTHDLTVLPVHFSADEGRATHNVFPYFNLEYGDTGVMLAVGWGGTWHADFVSDGTVTRYSAGAVNGMKTYLKPGESIRTALFVVAPYAKRDENYATNFWRRWFTECNLPEWDDNGTAMRPFSTACLALDTGMPNSDGSISERSFTWRPSMEKILSEGLHLDFRWFDAGWYLAPDGTSPESDWWGTVGTWELDRNKWPGDSFRESTDFARAHDMKTLMWFEPERITHPEALAENYGYDLSWAIRMETEGSIYNNIGIPECFDWTLERICKVLRENRVEMYREDYNIFPRVLWEHADAAEGENRVGITEAKIIDAHYRLWDKIIECTLSYGGCGFVDSCASGGGRNDLESLRRGVPILRSDADRTSTALRLSMTTAFNRWVPFCGANTREKVDQVGTTGNSDSYIWRASYLPILNIDSQYVYEPSQNFDVLRGGLSEWDKVKNYLLKDYYVLTPWHSRDDTTGYTAYAFYDDQTRKGVLFGFRMESCRENTVRLCLPFADTNVQYVLTDEESGEIISVSGNVLRNVGITLAFDTPRTARLFWITEK